MAEEDDVDGMFQDRLTEALEDAASEVMRPVQSPIPGLRAFEVTSSVQLGDLSYMGNHVGLWLGMAIPEGVYVVATEEQAELVETYRLGLDDTPVILIPHAVTMDERDAEAVTDGRDVGEGGAPGTFSIDLSPISAECGKALTVNDIAAWQAFKRAMESGDGEFARNLLVAVYGRYAKAEGPDTPRQSTGRPREHVQGISRLTDKVTEIKPNTGTVYVDMSGRNEARRSVLTSIRLQYEGSDFSLSKPMSPYDREVHNAVATLWHAGMYRVTIRQIYNAMTGANGTPSKKAEKRIEESLDRQRVTVVSIDFSAEMRGRNGVVDGEEFTVEQCKRETYMLTAEKATLLSSDGREVVGYIILQEPVLYWHDRRTHQMISFPQALLEKTSAVARNTETNLLMRSYLLKRIKTMSRKGSKLSKQIRYETVYREAGVDGPTRTERNRMNKTIREILNVLKSEGEIAGWEEYTEGSSHRILGVRIKTKAGNNCVRDRQ
jgi:hypothetical protein